MIFFFQAEDGIRDTSVTGVQTCALPISDAIQIRRAGRVTRIREYLLWSPPVPLPERRLQLAGSPTIVTRAEWQADESIRRAPPTYASTLQLAVVHHTVTTNDYSCAGSASIVRGLETYHVKA